jgi:hypothetical protein
MSPHHPLPTFNVGCPPHPAFCFYHASLYVRFNLNQLVPRQLNINAVDLTSFQRLRFPQGLQTPPTSTAQSSFLLRHTEDGVRASCINVPEAYLRSKWAAVTASSRGAPRIVEFSKAFVRISRSLRQGFILSPMRRSGGCNNRSYCWRLCDLCAVDRVSHATLRVYRVLIVDVLSLRVCSGPQQTRFLLRLLLSRIF